MNDRSKGISSDIDLTMDGMFRRGVGPAEPSFTDPSPGVKPWNADGTLKEKLPTYQWTNTSAIQNLLYYNHGWDNLSIPRNAHLEPEAKKEFANAIIDEFMTSSNVDPLWLIIDDVSTHAGRIYYDASVHTATVTPSPTYVNYSTGLNTTTSIIGSSYDYYNTTTGYDMPYAFSEILIGRDITPTEFTGITLTSSERDGGLILGASEMISKKQRLRSIVSRVEELKKRYKQLAEPTERRCTLCGKPFRSKIASDRCPSCANVIPMDQVVNANTLARPPVDYRMSQHGSKHIEDALCLNDTSLWYDLREDKTPDFYFQPVHSDRGLHLIRRSRNSHELQITLDGGEIVDTTDQPYRQEGPYRLTYEKAFLESDGDYHPSIDRLGWILNDLVNGR